MADRGNHYEAAFEAFLRQQRLPYLAVDEARRSLMGDGRSLKSLDFVVTTDGGVTWLIDVKGRRFPSGETQKQYWKNWSFRDDLDSLRQWEALFGPGFAGMFVFAYHVLGDRAPLPAGELFAFRRNLYAFLGIELGVYMQYAEELSPSWETVAMRRGVFRRLVRPVHEFLGVAATAASAADALRPVPDQLPEVGPPETCR